MTFQATLLDLIEAVGALPRRHVEGTSLQRVSLRQGQKRFLFLAVSQEAYSDPEGHVVSLLYPNLMPHAKLRYFPEATPMNQRVRLACSCPAWKWWGSKVLSTTEKYRLPEMKYIELRPADVRDPAGENFICKHALKVGQHVTDMTFSQLLSEATSPKTAMHAQAAMDQLAGPIASFMARHGYDSGGIEQFLRGASPDTLEDGMAALGMICESVPEDDAPPA